MNPKPGDNRSPILLTDEIQSFAEDVLPVTTRQGAPTCNANESRVSGSQRGSAHGGHRPPFAPDATVRCPFCSEHILASAKKCKHCGEFFDKRNTIKAPVGAPSRVHRAGEIIYSTPTRRAAHWTLAIVLTLIALGYVSKIQAPSPPVVAAVATTVHAASHIDACRKAAALTVLMAEKRDQGLSRMAALAYWEHTDLSESAKLAIENQLNNVYNFPEVTPQQAGRYTLDGCNK